MVEVDLTKSFSSILEMRLVTSFVLLICFGLIFFIIWAVLLGGGGYHQYLTKNTWYLPLCMAIIIALIGLILPYKVLGIVGAIFALIIEFSSFLWPF